MFVKSAHFKAKQQQQKKNSQTAYVLTFHYEPLPLYKPVPFWTDPLLLPANVLYGWPLSLITSFVKKCETAESSNIQRKYNAFCTIYRVYKKNTVYLAYENNPLVVFKINERQLVVQIEMFSSV